MEALVAILLVILLLGAIMSYASLSWGWVLYKYWGWFILPVFTDAPTINYWQAVGLMLVIGLFNRSTSIIKDEYTDNSKMWGHLILGPWIALFIAWIIRSVWIM